MKEVEVGSGGRRSWEEGSRWKEGGGERKGKREIGGKEGERRRPTKSHVHNGCGRMGRDRSSGVCVE